VSAKAIRASVLKRAAQSLVAAALLGGIHQLALADGLPLSSVQGGAVADPLVKGKFVYLPEGRTVTIWNYGDPTAPKYVGVTDVPAGGQVVGLGNTDEYLYVGWRSGDDRSGISVYSLDKARKPTWVKDIAYLDAGDYPMLDNVAVANDKLYVFDEGWGLMVGDLSDPLAPSFSFTNVAATATYVKVSGDEITASGTNWFGDRVLSVIDISDAANPQKVGSTSVDSSLYLRVRGHSKHKAIAVGTSLGYYHIKDGTTPEFVSGADMSSAMSARDAFMSGDYAYTIGSSGLGIWDLSDTHDIQLAGNIDMPTLGADAVAEFKQGAYFATSTDWMTRVDTSNPTAPAVTQLQIPVGVDVRDAAQVGDKLVFLESSYGLSVVDLDSLAPVSRFDADLDESLASRDFEAMAVVGNTAYLSAWGYGLIVVDLSDLTHPVELGRTEVSFPSVIAVSGDYAYLADTTNGIGLTTVDVSDPTAPTTTSIQSVSGQMSRIVIRDGYLYASEGGAGLAIYSLETPSQPALVTEYDDGCGSGSDVAISDTDPETLYLACDGELRVLDISSPAAPSLKGTYEVDADYGAYSMSLAQHGDALWLGNYDGVRELDVSDASNPQLVQKTETGGWSPGKITRTVDGRVFAFGGTTGVHIFGSSDGTLPAGVARELSSGKKLNGVHADAAASVLFKIAVPTGTEKLRVMVTDGSGSYSLLVKQGSAPTSASDADAVGQSTDSGQSAKVKNPDAGDWYISLVAGEEGFDGVSVKAVAAESD